MSSGKQPPERVGEVGPVELTGGLAPDGFTPDGFAPPDGFASPDAFAADALAPSDTAVGGTGPGRLERRLGAWWQALGPRRRRAGTAGLVLAVAAALAVPALTHRTPAPPVPLPGDLTAVRYLGIGSVGTGLDNREFSIVITVGDTGTVPLTVRRIGQGYAGLTLAAQPVLPVTVRPGQLLTFSLRATVHDCAVIPPDDPYPVLLLTVSDGRATQVQSAVLGAPYILAMHGALLRACRGTPGFGGPFPQRASDTGVFPP